MVNKMAISQFWSGEFREKLSVLRGLDAHQFFGRLKRALELLISVRMSPFATFKHHWVDTITPEKQQQKTNKYTSACLFDLPSGKKKQNSTFL